MKKPAIPKTKTLVRFDKVDVSSRFDDVYEVIRPDEMSHFQKVGTTFHIASANGVELRIDVHSDAVFRIRYKARGEWQPDFSYAIDPGYSPKGPKTCQLEEKEDYLEIITEELRCRIMRNRLKVHFYNAAGKSLVKDKKGYRAYSTILSGMSDVSVEKKLDKSTSYFGLGDKSGPLKLNGRKYENWNTDAFAYGNDTDPLYKSIPFTVGHKKGRWFGLFFDNSYRSWFDFGKGKSGRFRFGAGGGEINYYFFSGNDSQDVAKTYARLTGKPELPAMWMLGFHQCRWSYYPESRVMEVAEEFRKRKIPCDAIYLDIDYMDGYRCFTWNDMLFPDPKGMIHRLEDKGFRTVVMIDPGLKVDPTYKVYTEGLEKDYFCRRTDGELMMGPVWPDNCVFPDFTKPEVRRWWGGLYRELYEEHGVHGFWNDMNEPAVFKVNHKTFPDAVRHEYDGHPTDHRKGHNIYGQQMVRATQDGLKRIKPDNRPLVITRATYAGGQRFSFGWTGDNIASWEHLKLASTQCQRMSLSGFSLIGSDIGGFVDVPDPELMVRWTQLGAFHPFFRIHSMGNNVDGAAGTDADAIKEEEKVNRLDQEPWSFGKEAEAGIRSAIEFRYQLLPYLYTLCHKLSQDGSPVMRSLVLENPDDPRYKDWEEAFFSGEQLLVFPICQPGVRDMALPLPSGEWYDYHTGEKVKLKKGYILHSAEADKLPVFARAGAIIPNYPVRQSTLDSQAEKLILHAFYAKEAAISELFEDEGDGYKYQKNGYLLRAFRQEGNGESWMLRQEREGNYQEPYEKTALILHGLPFKPQAVEVDGKSISFKYSKEGVLTCEIPGKFKFVEVKK
ncbi:MAG: DUF4968 domain-containing protein [Bacteroidetes bacterium]|nr:DUF4968 domain-containing protein [Bacteroidota bacterium]